MELYAMLPIILRGEWIVAVGQGADGRIAKRRRAMEYPLSTLPSICPLYVPLNLTVTMLN